MMFSMRGWKATGLNGSPAIFFESDWDPVKEVVCKWVKDVF